MINSVYLVIIAAHISINYCRRCDPGMNVNLINIDREKNI